MTHSGLSSDKVALRLLSHGQLFSGCSAKEVEKVIKAGLTNSFRAGDCIFWKNDPGQALYAIVDGTVEIRLPQAGGEDVLAILRTGDVFGEMAVVTRKSRAASAVATTEVQLFVLNDTELRSLLESQPKTAARIFFNLLSITSDRLREKIDTPDTGADSGEYDI